MGRVTHPFPGLPEVFGVAVAAVMLFAGVSPVVLMVLSVVVLLAAVWRRA